MREWGERALGQSGQSLRLQVVDGRRAHPSPLIRILAWRMISCPPSALLPASARSFSEHVPTAAPVRGAIRSIF